MICVDALGRQIKASDPNQFFIYTTGAKNTYLRIAQVVGLKESKSFDHPDGRRICAKAHVVWKDLDVHQSSPSTSYTEAGYSDVNRPVVFYGLAQTQDQTLIDFYLQK